MRIMLGTKVGNMDDLFFYFYEVIDNVNFILRNNHLQCHCFFNDIIHSDMNTKLLLFKLNFINILRP